MMKVGKTVLIVIAVLGTVTACATMPTEEEMAKADFGAYMTQTECENSARKVMNILLKDPGSAQYQFGKCKKQGFSSVPILRLPKQYGYAIEFTVNAKNSFGGYTGAKRYLFLFKNGILLRKLSTGDSGASDMLLPF